MRDPARFLIYGLSARIVVMKLQAYLLLAVLTGVFFATYAVVVENPLVTNRIDFRAYVAGVLSLAIDSSDFHVCRLGVAIMFLLVAQVGIRFLKRMLQV